MASTEKRCPRCGETKPREEFNRARSRKDGLQTYCRECQRERDRKTYATHPRRKQGLKRARAKNLAKNREFLLTYLRAHPCVDCGESDPLVLDFDHVRGVKRLCVGRMVGHGIETLRAEVAKCEVRCGNCHRLKTARDHGWWIYKVTRRGKNSRE